MMLPLWICQLSKMLMIKQLFFFSCKRAAYRVRYSGRAVD